MPHFAMYWRPSTVDAARSEDDRLLYAASNQFDRVASGDVLWLLSAPEGRLTLVGRLCVDRVVDRATAISHLGSSSLWPAKIFALPPPRQAPDRIRSIDLTSEAAELRFVSADSEGKLDIAEGGAVNPQQLQTMRLLSDESVHRLEAVWATRNERLVRVSDRSTIRANMREFNANAAENIDRARSLFASTEYWVCDEASGEFGPGKFVGYEAMSFAMYESAHRDEIIGARFDGHVTRKAIEGVLGDFVEDDGLAYRLVEWAEKRIGKPLPAVDSAKWRFVRLVQGDAGNARAKPRKEEPVDDQMYDCDARLLFVEKDGAKVWRWEKRAVKSIGDDRDVRCTHCHGAVRIHRQKVPHGPADHVEHLRREDSEHCRGGHYFKGEHRRSTTPVA